MALTVDSNTTILLTTETAAECAVAASSPPPLPGAAYGTAGSLESSSSVESPLELEAGGGGSKMENFKQIFKAIHFLH